ncbi:MAG: hypothetical protein N2509_04595 [Treponemataceae bacterium]|nr:hypothetical protein [Treponemataceae bacterium]
MKAIGSIIRFYFTTFYALPTLRDPHGKISAKSLLKLGGTIILFGYIFGAFGYMSWEVYSSLYQILAPIGLARLVLVYALLYGGLVVAFISFISGFSTVYTNEMETYLATLPVRPVHLLVGKAASLAIPHFSFALFAMGGGFVLYGIAEKMPWLFFINALLVVLMTTIWVSALGYCISIPLLLTSKFFRNRDRILVLVGLAMMGIIFFFNFSINRFLYSSATPEELMALLQGPNETFVRLLDALPPLQFILVALFKAAHPWYTLALLGIVGLVSLAAYGVFFVLAPLHTKAIRLFSEQHLKRMSRTQTAAFLKTKTGPQRKLVALLLRELRSMNREPVYFLNGPFIIILIPLLIGISLVVSLGNQGSLNELREAIRTSLTPLYQVLASSLVGAFLGSATSITCTALSRDAKHISYMKTLPVSSSLYLMAKLLHGLLFGLAGSLIAVFLGLFLFQLELPLGAFVLASSLTFSALFNVIGLYIDTLAPRLNWESPVAAMKQNMNAVVMILMEILVLIGAAVLTIFWAQTWVQLTLAMVVVPLFLVGGLLAFYIPFGERKLRKLEV